MWKNLGAAALILQFRNSDFPTIDDSVFSKIYKTQNENFWANMTISHAQIILICHNYSFIFFQEHLTRFFLHSMTIFKMVHLYGFCELVELPQHSSDVFFNRESIFECFRSVGSFLESIRVSQGHQHIRKHFRKVAENQ